VVRQCRYPFSSGDAHLHRQEKYRPLVRKDGQER